MHAPLVSVIVVNHNYGAFVEECLRSVDGQTYPKIDCVIVDNMSTDDSAHRIENFIKAHSAGELSRTYRFLQMSANVGQTAAAIDAFKTCAGQFIVFMDADDFLHPRAIEKHVHAHLVSRRSVGFSSVDMFQMIDGGVVASTTSSFSGHVMSSTQRTPEVRALDRETAQELFGGGELRASLDLSTIHHISPAASSVWCWSPTSGLCFRRDAIELMFSYKPGLYASLDAYLTRGISCLCGSLLVDEPLAYYRVHGKNFFARRPPLERMRAYAQEQLVSEETDVSREILRSYVHNAMYLSKVLEHHGFFFDAMSSAVKYGSHSLEAANARFLEEFLIEHRSALASAFGRDVFNEWLRRARLKTAFGGLKRRLKMQ